MRYMLLIFQREGFQERPTPEELAALDHDHGAHTIRLVGERVLIATCLLHSSGTATTVRLRGTRLLTTDGPFADAGEQLVGFHLVDCADLEQALRIAAELPTARQGAIEVRPVRDGARSHPDSREINFAG